ncbi:MAG: hypothetical protein ACI9MR_004865 [Myxococcota bacterium]|jgi:hypothetical protein
MISNAGSAKTRVLRVTTTLFAISALGATGCDMGLQQTLDGKKAERFAAAKAAVTKVESDRLAFVKSSEPKPEAMPGADGTDPIIAWRKAIAARSGDRATLLGLSKNAMPAKGMTVGAKGTPSQRGAEYSSDMLVKSAEFWAEMDSSEAYRQFLNGYIQTSVNGYPERIVEAPEGEEPAEPKPKVVELLPLFIDEARFDQTFSLIARGLTPKRSWLYEDWGQVFGVGSLDPKNPASSLMKLCLMSKDLIEACKGVPAEDREKLVARKYLEQLAKSAAAYKAASEDGKTFEKVLGGFAAKAQKGLATPLQIVEDPMLPGTVAPPSGLSGLEIVLSPTKGVQIQTLAIPRTFETVSPSFTGSVPGDFSAQLTRIIQTIKDTPGTSMDVSRAIIQAPGTMSLASVRTMMTMLPIESITKTVLVGRRRIGGNMRRAGLEFRRPIPDDLNRPLQYKFAEDAGPTSCTRMGYLGDRSAVGGARYYMEFTGLAIRVAKYKVNKETKQVEVDPTEQIGSFAPADRAATITKLEAWLASHPGYVSVFVPSSLTYDEASMLLSRIVYECSELAINTPGVGGSQGEEIKQECGRSKMRPVFAAVGFCG